MQDKHPSKKAGRKTDNLGKKQWMHRLTKTKGETKRRDVGQGANKTETTKTWGRCHSNRKALGKKHDKENPAQGRCYRTHIG